ncbi:MAG TPA: hypothetical protein VM076_17940 [Gemmatimonadaceae bacterium]|nr:hypothetical protein [Gemmatimonadaceae bacterium]
MSRSRLNRAAPVALALTLASACLTPTGAQQRLLPRRTATIGPVFERWSFGSGLLQPAIDGSGSVALQSAAAWSLPIGGSVGFGERWTLDVSTAYASGTVKLATVDPSLGRDEYSLSGLTDIHTRLTGRLFGDNVIATLGLNVPTGTTELDAEQFAALRVLGAPALAMQTPALGTGVGGTAGIVVARQVGAWAWALGASYELRQSYTPIAFATNTAGPDVNPGDALHLTLGADGLVGQNGMTLALSTDLFSKDALEPSASGTSAATVSTKLGPIFTVDWQLRVAAPRLRELTFYIVDRYRSAYERSEQRVDQSSGNYLDGGVRSVFPLSPTTGLLSVLNLRHQTGLKSDSTLATAATAAGGVTFGVVKSFAQGYSVQPFVRGDFGKIRNVDASVTATGLSAGISLGRQF